MCVHCTWMVTLTKGLSYTLALRPAFTQGSHHNLLHPLGHTREGFIILWGREEKMAALPLLSFPTASPCPTVTPLGQSSFL